MDSEHKLLPGMILQKRYRIEAFIGQGSFGRTYLARDQKLYNRKCVVKQLFLSGSRDGKTQHRVEQCAAHEAHVLTTVANLRHPHIPKIIDYIAEEHCIVTEFIRGKTLQAYQSSQRSNTVPTLEALRYARDIADALAHLHAYHTDEGVWFPIIHRDVKPSNIMISNGPLGKRAHLIDFGIAIAAVQNAGIGIPYPPGRGTKCYMAPELREKEGKAHLKSDVFSLGRTLEKILTNDVAPTTGDKCHHEYKTKKKTKRWHPFRTSPRLDNNINTLITVATAEKDLHVRPTAAGMRAHLDTLIALQRSRHRARQSTSVLAMLLVVVLIFLMGNARVLPPETLPDLSEMIARFINPPDRFWHEQTPYADNQGAIVYDKPVTGAISDPEIGHVWNFEANPGDKILIVCTSPSPTFAPAIELEGRNGITTHKSMTIDQHNRAFIDVYDGLPPGGNYNVLVSSHDEGGEYTLTITSYQLRNDFTISLPAVPSVQEFIVASDGKDVISIDHPHQVPREFDLVWSLYKLHGSKAHLTGTGQSFNNIPIPEQGTYSLRLRSLGFPHVTNSPEDIYDMELRREDEATVP